VNDGGTRGMPPTKPGGGGMIGVPLGIKVGCAERASGYGGRTPGCGTGGGWVIIGGLVAL
jgi:hypothetical protein